MDVVIIILSSLALVGVIICIILVLTKKNEAQTPIDLKEIGILTNKIDSISSQMKGEIERALSNEMVKFNQQALDTNEKQNEKLERFQNNITSSLDTKFDSLRKQVDDKLLEISKKVDEKLAEGFKGTNETFSQVRERLQAIDDAQKNIEVLGKDVVSLRNVLEGNQSRGQYGEFQLSLILHNVFGEAPGCYEEQYTMKKVKDGDDVRADAVIFMPEPNKMICIDSKFPFKDYERLFTTENEQEKESLRKDFAAACKKHITAISNKYIIEGKTAPNALMFIPNDAVFAYIHQYLGETVIKYAREKNVIVTSPSTLAPILVTINMVRIEAERAKNVQEISKHLAALGKDFEKFGEEWEKFSNQLATASKSREALDNRVNKITGKFDNIKNSSDLGIEEKDGD